MTKIIQESDLIDFDRLPSYDVSFQLNGKNYINPSPPIQRKSKFYIHGRPRNNSTNIKTSPHVAETFPLLNKDEWDKAKIGNCKIKESYEEYYKLYKKELLTERTVTRPFVPINIQYYSFLKWCNEHSVKNDFYTLCIFANEIFDKKVKDIIFSARNVDENKIVTTNYIYLITEEIGQDKFFDISSAYMVNQTMCRSKKYLLFKNLNIFHEYGLSLVSSYAIKNNIDTVYYKIDKTFGWY